MKTLGELLQAEQWDEAIDFLNEYLKSKPQDAEGWNALSYVYSRKSHDEQALQASQKALSLEPANINVLNNIALLSLRCRRWSEAEQASRLSLELNPDQVDAYDFLSHALMELKKMDEALSMALEWQSRTGSDYAEAHYRVGSIYILQRKYSQAVESLATACSLNPLNPNYHANHGVALRFLGDYKSALIQFQKAVHCDPDHAVARLNRATAWLLLGNYTQGFPEFESRYLTHPSLIFNYEKPLWDGSPLNGKTLLVHTEQGHGDSIQMARYLPLIKDARVIVDAHPALKRWFEGLEGVDEVVLQGSPRPAFNLQASMFSLPRIFKTTLENIPQPVCPSTLKHQSKERLVRRVGVVWQGNPSHDDDAARSCKLEMMKSLFALQNIEWVSLQKNPTLEDQAMLKECHVNSGVDECEDFWATAEVMSGLDLVIGVDTSVIHLAASMGIPTWVMLAIPHDWRWMLNRADSPWYPSVRLFRQTTRGDWSQTINEIAQELSLLTKSS